jgi:Ca2+-binding EF-hand superfamily protein
MANQAAERLKRLIRRAEAGGSRQEDCVSLESAFEHFDSSHRGIINPSDLQTGLKKLGESFSFSLDECRALLGVLSNNKSQEGISLLGWYRALGRHSPPPSIEGGSSRRGSDLVNSPVVHAEDAANRLRDLVKQAELKNGKSVDSFFELFNSNNTGKITATDFLTGLQTLGGTFAELHPEDCVEVRLCEERCDELIELVSSIRRILCERNLFLTPNILTRQYQNLKIQLPSPLAPRSFSPCSTSTRMDK